jgi:WW domain
LRRRHTRVEELSLHSLPARVAELCSFAVSVNVFLFCFVAGTLCRLYYHRSHTTTLLTYRQTQNCHHPTMATIATSPRPDLYCSSTETAAAIMDSFYNQEQTRWENSQEYYLAGEQQQQMPTPEQIQKVANLVNELSFWGCDSNAGGDDTSVSLLAGAQQCHSSLLADGHGTVRHRTSTTTPNPEGSPPAAFSHHQQQRHTPRHIGRPNLSSSDAPAQDHETSADAAASVSPTLSQLKRVNTWQKAVDPASGRAYYYDTITRKTQWEKVCACVCFLK